MVEEDVAHVVSSSHYQYHTSCSARPGRFEIVSLNTSHLIDSPVTAWIYPQSDCSGVPFPVEVYLPVCHYKFRFSNGNHVWGNARSVYLPPNTTLKMFPSCRDNRDPTRIVKSGSNGTCVALNHYDRTSMLFVAGKHPAEMHRVVVGDYEDRVLGQSSVAGFDVADNTVDCKVQSNKLYILLNDYKKCEHPSVAVLSHHGLEWIEEIDLPSATCSAPRAIHFIDDDRLLVACDTHLREIHLPTGNQSSHEMTYTFVDAWGNERYLVTSPVHISTYAENLYVMSTTGGSNTIVTRMTPANMSHRVTSHLDISFPESVAVNIRSGVIYLLSSHALRSFDLKTMEILFRNEECGTTTLEFGDAAVSSVHSDSRTGFVYGTAMYYPLSGLMSIREKGLSLDRIDELRVTEETGYMYSIHPREGENQTMITSANVSTPVRVRDNGYMLTGTTIYASYPPALFVYPLRGCSVGRAGTSVCAPCLAGKEAPREGMRECTACPPGRHAELNETVVCEGCPRGYFAGSSGSPECEACAPGKYADMPESAECENCPAGEVHSLLGSSRSTDCTACSIGETAAPGSSRCVECPVGWQKVGPNQCDACSQGRFGGRGIKPCNPCPVGKHGTRNGSSIEAAGCVVCPTGRVGLSEGLSQDSDCTVCSSGKYRGSGQNSCETCPAGRVAPNAGQTSCTICDDGSTPDAPGMACAPCEKGRVGDPGNGLCVPCPPGRISDVTGASNSTWCTPCEGGAYSVTSTECATCPTGTYGTLPGQSSMDSCLQCPPGRYGSSPGTCTSCPLGKFNAQPGAVGRGVCEVCPAGTFRDTPGGASERDCSDCPAGTRSTPSFERCVSCPSGLFSTTGQARCSECDAGKVAPKDGSVSCDRCPPDSEPWEHRTSCRCVTGTYGTNKSGILLCEACPSRAECNAPNQMLHTLQIAPGYWRHSNTTLEIRRCPEPEACKGGSLSECREGHEGPLCAVCKKGHAKTGDGLCAVCPPEQAGLNVAVTVLAPIALTALVVVMILTANGSEDSTDDNRFSGIMKITSTMLQIYTVCAAFDVKWPKLLVEIFDRSDSLNPTLGFYSAQCSFKWTYFDRAYAYVAMPLVYLTVASLIVMCVARLYAREGNRWAFTSHWITTSTVVGLFLMYTAVLKSLMRGFSCDQVGGEYYLSTDYSVHCYEGEHATFMWIGAAALILYGVGIPAFAILLIWRYRFKLHKAKALQFLHRGYRRERYFWEVVVVVRKIAVIAMSIFLFRGEGVTRYQSPVAAWFFLGCLLLHLTAEPFDSLTEYGRIMALLESSAITSCIFTLNAGIIFGTHADDYEHGSFEMFILVVTLFICGLVGVLFAYHIVRSGWSRGKMGIRKALRVCCYRNRPSRETVRRRDSALRVWVETEEEPTEQRKLEIEMTHRSQAVEDLDVLIEGSLRLQSARLSMEESQRRRLYELQKDLKSMGEITKSADQTTRRAFRAEWRRHVGDLVARMRPMTTEESDTIIL